MATATLPGGSCRSLPILVALLMTLALEFKHADAPAVTTDAQPVSNLWMRRPCQCSRQRLTPVTFSLSR
jgi:hypothetical protein